MEVPACGVAPQKWHLCCILSRSPSLGQPAFKRKHYTRAWRSEGRDQCWGRKSNQFWIKGDCGWMVLIPRIWTQHQHWQNNLLATFRFPLSFSVPLVCSIALNHWKCRFLSPLIFLTVSCTWRSMVSKETFCPRRCTSHFGHQVVPVLLPS